MFHKEHPQRLSQRAYCYVLYFPLLTKVRLEMILNRNAESRANRSNWKINENLLLVLKK